jgi:type IV pilus assembly protein PilM
MKLIGEWFGSKPAPIGVDLGSDALRLIQVETSRRGAKTLVAAASAAVPAECRQSSTARIDFFQDATRKLLTSGGFRGRQAVLSLPAACMHIERLRLPKFDDAQTKQAVQFESRGKLPIDPCNALLRHVVAGEVYQAQEPMNEVIVMAAGKEVMQRYLAAAGKAKLDVVGMTAEPQATVDCFAHALSGSAQASQTRMFVDLGLAGTRVYIARGPQLLFARALPLGGMHLNQAVATQMKIPLEKARELRSQRHQGSGEAKREAGNSTEFFPLAIRPKADAGGGTAVATPPVAPAAMNPVDAACAAVLRSLIDELELCLRYHEMTFPSCPVEQVTFIGGEANKRTLCQHIASALGLPAQTGDPLSRIDSSGGSLQGLDPSRPQPAWAVAVGLSLGTVA